MIAFIIRRLMYTAPIVIGVLLLTFTLFTLVGGDTSREIAGKNATAETIAETRHEYGFDKYLFLGIEHEEVDLKGDTLEEIDAKIQAARDEAYDVFSGHVKSFELITAFKMIDFDTQFFDHFKKAITFNFGSGLDREPIIDKIKRGVIPSLTLTVPMFVSTLLISISLSLIVAFIRGTIWDVIIVVICVAGMSVPFLSYILFGQYYFTYVNDWFPVYFSPEYSMAQIVALPVIIGIVAGLGANLRFYRTIMLDEMRNDYVRTAFAKGLSSRRVLFKHVLKNAMIPIVTQVVLSLPFLFLGNLLLERFFGIPGLGSLMVDAIHSRDFFVINAMTFIIAIIFVLATLAVDICYALIDPRISFD